MDDSSYEIAVYLLLAVVFVCGYVIFRLSGHNLELAQDLDDARTELDEISAHLKAVRYRRDAR